MFLAILVLGYFLTYLIQPFIVGLITEAGLVRPNYRKQLIPQGLGLIFLFSTIMALGFGIALQFFYWEDSLIVIFLIVALGLLGLIDDSLGSRSASGFKGHFRQLLKKRLTTGALKALMGGLSALLVSFLITQGNWIELLLNALIISLATNTFNLLDLRPGRAIKFFFIAVIPFLLFFWNQERILFLAPLLGGILAYFPIDLKAKGMMGDTGSNILGGVLGLIIAWNLVFATKIIILGFLVLFHLYTEKYSLTETIARVSWLKYLDELGRKGEKKDG